MKHQRLRQQVRLGNGVHGCPSHRLSSITVFEKNTLFSKCAHFHTQGVKECFRKKVCFLSTEHNTFSGSPCTLCWMPQKID
ncbi:hypothetical protein M758_12G178300 [Ceratodon purpureus]|nr:hypothetical protein M758_12G178300 [Ceratodon purpureus]